MEYIVHISRASDNVASTVVNANSDAEAFALAKKRAAPLEFAIDDPVLLEVKLPAGGFKIFLRKDF